MNTARFIAGAALVAAPLSIVSGQAKSSPDSSGNHNTAKWIAGTGAVGGATFFLAFANSGTSANHNSFAPPVTVTTLGDNSTTPPPATTPPSTTPPPATPPLPPVTTTTASPSAETPTDTTHTPATTYTTSTPDTPPSDPTDSLFTNPGDTPPHEDAPPAAEFETPSTVPEPGSLALTATGIIGLIPLIRRRRR